MKKAVALRYTIDVPAPFILAKGRRELASRLLQIAEENGITIIDDERLTDALYMFDPGTSIPEYLYELVAELLAYVFAIEHGEKT